MVKPPDPLQELLVALGGEPGGNALRVCAQALRRHAPSIAALVPHAPWDATIQRAVLAEFTERLSPDEERFAGELAGGVILHGRNSGLWTHAPWIEPRSVPALPSALRLDDRAAIKTAIARQSALIDALDRLLSSTDATLVTGALIIAAADCSGVVLPRYLRQMPDAWRHAKRYDEIVVVDLQRGTHDVPLTQVRRWVPDEVSHGLIRRLNALQPKSTAKAEPALARALGFLGLEVISLDTLCTTATARWSTVWPALLRRYALDPTIGVALPPTALQRLVSGQPLPPGAAPAPQRRRKRDAAARQAAAWMIELRLSAPTADPEDYGPALDALAGTMRRSEGDPLLSADELDDRLTNWRAAHPNANSWLVLLSHWIEEALLIRKTDPNARDGRPVASSMLRYFGGFADRFMACFHDADPAAVMDDADALVARMERLQLRVAELDSRAPVDTGLRAFLRFVEANGGPHIVFTRDRRFRPVPPEPDANVLTPLEFRRLLAHLAGHDDPFEAARTRVTAILAWRAGLRWEELQTLQFDNPHADPAHRVAVLSVVPNTHFAGKSRNAPRKLELEHYLTAAELDEVMAFAGHARFFDGFERPSTDFLLANPALPDVPPSDAELHDIIQDAMRLVSGDESLVFHHLRHSAANALFLRLFAADDALAVRYWFADDALPSGATDSDAAVGFMTTLTGRRADDPSRPYALSKVLGHFDPATSLASYLHLIDWLAFAAARRALVLPTTARAALGGVSVRSQRTYDSRARRRGAAQATCATTAFAR